jgi:hypothetical protein
MAPTKKAPAAKENVSLGPLAGDGMLKFSISAYDHNSDKRIQASSFSALLASSPPSTTPSFTLPIFRTFPFFFFSFLFLKPRAQSIQFRGIAHSGDSNTTQKFNS